MILLRGASRRLPPDLLPMQPWRRMSVVPASVQAHPDVASYPSPASAPHKSFPVPLCGQASGEKHSSSFPHLPPAAVGASTRRRREEWWFSVASSAHFSPPFFRTMRTDGEKRHIARSFGGTLLCRRGITPLLVGPVLRRGGASHRRKECAVDDHRVETLAGACTGLCDRATLLPFLPRTSASPALRYVPLGQLASR